MTNSKFIVTRAEIHSTTLKGDDSEQNGDKLVLIVQCEAGNKNSPNVTVLPLTSSLTKRSLPTHVSITPNEMNKLNKSSIVLAECITTISKNKLKNCIGTLSEFEMKKVDVAMGIHLQMLKDREQGNFRKPEYYAFDTMKARMKAQNLVNLEKIVLQNTIISDKETHNEILNSIKFQYEDLKEYCEFHGKNVDLFYRPRINFSNVG